MNITWWHRFSARTGPLEATAASPPDRQARRHWHTDFALTRRDRAICLAFTSRANICAASNRTCSRPDLARAVSPPPSGYLMRPA